MYSKTTIMGRICHDLELRTTPTGKNVCSFRVAVDRRFQKQGEERKADFYNVVAWGAQAEFVTRYFGKGRMILAEGEMQSRKYTDKNGVEREVWELIADRLTFTGEKSQSAGGAPSTPSAPQQAAAPAPAQQTSNSFSNDFASAPSDDDYPF